MNKKAGLIDEILSGVKTIESRWYKNEVAPWNKIKEGEVIYFKDSGGLVRAKATVSEVIQVDNLNEEKFINIVKRYGDAINLRTREYVEYYKLKNYCILLRLINSQKIEPFQIDKKGFGNACAWMCVEDINRIKK
ncbi:ASCH domain-containing protein [Candidatus Dojkabacteria bacterium]|nr:ASCH domain-containing protein [Candidatus Dojkabacteria bacterium]